MTNSRAVLEVDHCGPVARVSRAGAYSPQRWTTTRPARDGWLDVAHQLLGDGVFAGDHHRMRVRAKAGTNLVVRAVAATSLRAGAMSSFASRISVGAGASCIYLPGALIPHAGSAHVSSLAVRAADDARVLAVTVVTPGRTGMGERGSFTSLRMRATLVAGEEVLLAEDADFAPGTTPLDSEATFAGAGAVVSAVVSGDWDASTVEWWATLFADTDVAGYAGSLRGIRTRGVRVAAICSSLGAAQRVVAEIESRTRLLQPM